MPVSQLKAIDCDVHPTVPGWAALTPYLDPFWRDSVEERGIGTLESISYPPGAPHHRARGLPRRGHVWRRQALADLAPVFDRWGADIAILNCLYGIQLVFNEDMAAAFARALNDWIAKEWLDRDPRLRASIVVPLQNVEHAVDEIERRAPDRRFVQVLVLAMGEVPLGRRALWPVYAAAERHRPADRHPRRLRLPQSGDRARLAELLHRGLCGAVAGVPEPGREPGQRGRVREVSRAQGGADRIRASPGCRRSCGGSRNSGAASAPRCRGSTARRPRSCATTSGSPSSRSTGRTRPTRSSASIEHLRSDDILLYSSDFPHWQFDGDARDAARNSGRPAAQDPGRQPACDVQSAQRTVRTTPMNVELRQPLARSAREAGGDRLRHPSDRDACGPAAVPVESLVGLPCRPTASAGATASPGATLIRR